MPAERLTMATLSGPADILDFVLREHILKKGLKTENAVECMRGVKKLYLFDEPNPYEELLQKAQDVADIAQLDTVASGYASEAFTPEDTGLYFDKLRLRLWALRDEYEKTVKRAEELNAMYTQISRMGGIDERLHDLFSLKYVKFRFGRLPNENFEECYSAVNSRDDAYFIRTGGDDDMSYGIYFALPGTYDQIDALLGSHGFERVYIEAPEGLGQTAGQFSQSLEEQARIAASKAKDLELLFHREKTENAPELLSRYSYVKLIRDAWELRANAGHSHGLFYVVVWIPEKDAPSYAAQCEAEDGLSCILTNAENLGRAVRGKKSGSFFRRSRRS